jgi:hypothetical protein
MKFYVYIPETNKRLGEPGSRRKQDGVATSDASYKRAIQYTRGEAIKKARVFGGIAVSVAKWKTGYRPPTPKQPVEKHLAAARSLAETRIISDNGGKPSGEPFVTDVGLIFTPVLPDGRRAFMRFNVADHRAVSGRGLGLRGYATDQLTGLRWKVFGKSCGGDCVCDARVEPADQPDTVVAALEASLALFDKGHALSRFNWGESGLRAEDIRELNELPGKIRSALVVAKVREARGE